MIPKMIVSPEIKHDKVIFNLFEKDIEISFSSKDKDNFLNLINELDGKSTISELSKKFKFIENKTLEKIINDLHDHGVVTDCSPPDGRSGIDVLLEIEDISNDFLHKTLYKNIFWDKCLKAQTKADIPINVMRGLAIENYHFLFRESYFDAPVLSYVGNLEVRLLLNNFYSEEYGHDELILKSLNSIGATREQMALTVPLPETMALCNALAYWSHNDPLFFFTTLGILEGKDLKQDSFIDAAIRIGLEKDFISPIQAHSNINLKGGHGNLTREIFSNIPIIESSTIQRLKSQTYLFIELYDALYTGIWDYYSNSSNDLLRLIDNI